MQTLITGSPGAGKTLYAIEKLILPMLGQKVRVQPMDADPYEVERTLYTNIKGFQIPHVMLEAGPVWEASGKEWRQAEGNRKGLHNWHEWAKPGDLIVVDEFQRVWPQRPNGSPVPPDLQAMDTHRHGGVDMILITQKQSFDQHLKGLIGRHLHVRRISLLPMAIVYEWDAHSHALQFSKAMAKKPWRYDKKVYKLYHSADAHTKQPRAIPTLAYVVLAAIGLAAWKIPESYGRIVGKSEEYAARSASRASTGRGPAEGGGPARHPPQEPAALAPAVTAAPRPALDAAVGCITFKERCECFDVGGVRVPADDALCREGSYRVGLFGGYGAQPHGDRRPGYPDDPTMRVKESESSDKTANAPPLSPASSSR